MQEIPKIARFRIALSELENEVWRIVDVPAKMSLAHFHVVIQIAMGWHTTHCHEFQTETGCYLDPREMDGEERDAIDEWRVTVAQLIQDPVRHTFIYRYDFGDCWDHVIELESVRDFDGTVFMPRCVAGAGACPPEDCGGSPGYRRCCKAYKSRGRLWTRDAKGNRLDSETVERLQWIGDWDPLHFNLQAVNGRLKGRFRNHRMALPANTESVQQPHG